MKYSEKLKNGSLSCESVLAQDSWSQQKKVIDLSTGIKMSYLEFGAKDRETVILLHGITDSSRSWALTIPYLVDNYHIYVVDQRGHGASEKPSTGYTPEVFCDDVVAFMDALEIGESTIVGHSMGSIIAQMVAINHSSRVNRLVLIGSAARGVNKEHLKEILVESEQFDYEMTPEFIEGWYENPNPVDKEFIELQTLELRRTPVFVLQKMLASILMRDLRQFLPKINVPTLVIWGEKDPFFSETDQLELLEHIPYTVFIRHRNIGHNNQWEAPLLVANDIIKFIENDVKIYTD